MKRIFVSLIVIMALCHNRLTAQICTPVNCLQQIIDRGGFAIGGLCDTIFAEGLVNQPYLYTQSFAFGGTCFKPKELDSTQTIDVDVRLRTVNNFTFSGLPNGIVIQTSASSYSVPRNGSSAGCARVNGTPTQAGLFQLSVGVSAVVEICALTFITQSTSAAFPILFKVLPNASFSGLNGPLCSAGAPITLTPTGTTGGVFSGPGIVGNTFNPSLAGPGTHTITYTVSAKQGLAIDFATNSSSQNITVTEPVLAGSVGLVTGPVSLVCPGTNNVAYSIVPVLNATGYVWGTTGDITIASGQGTTNPTFNFGNAFTSGTINVRALNANNCTQTALRSLAINSAPKTPGAIAGQTTGVCANTSKSYSIASVATATGYVWSTTGDISISGGQGTTNASFNFGPGFTTGTVRVQAQNVCGLSIVRTLTINSVPMLPGLITGPSTGVCANTTKSYSIAPVIAATGYVWSTTGAITISGGQGTTNANFNFGPGFTTGTVKVQAQNACGLSLVRSLTINSIPMSPGLMTGPTTGVCANTTKSYSIAPVIAATGYVWSTTGAITISGGQGTTNASFNFGPGFTTGTVKVQAQNACGLSIVRSLTINSIPMSPGLITGPSTGVCANTNKSYSIASVIAATGYVWSTTGDISISGGQGTTNASFNFGPGFTTGTVRVQAQNACGLSIVRSLTINSIPMSPGAITGPTTGVCANTTKSYSIAPVIAATGYVWSTTGAITISGGQGTTNASFNFGPGFTTGTVKVQAQNACGLSIVRSLTINSIPMSPGAITGPTTGVCANTTKSYSIAPVIAATGYVWSTTGAITISGGHGTTNASFNFGPGFTTGTVKVQAQNACGLSIVRSLTINSIPMSPGLITGPSTGVCANTNKSYSIASVIAATGYVWSTTGDISISGGQGTTNASFNFGPGFTTGTVKVQAQNACGLSIVRSLTINSIPILPGAITGQSIGIIAGTNGVPYSIVPVTAATSYFWETTGGVVIGSGQGTTGITANYPLGFITGTIKVKSVNACGSSLVRSLTVKGGPAILSDPIFSDDLRINGNKTLLLYPNPTKDILVIQAEGISQVLIFDLNGRLVQANKYQDANQVNLQIDHPKGMYFVQINGEGWTETRKLVVE